MRGNRLVAILLVSGIILTCTVALAQEQLPPLDAVMSRVVEAYASMHSIEMAIESHLEVNVPSQGWLRNDSASGVIWFRPPLLRADELIRIDEHESVCASYVVHVADGYAYCADAQGEWRRVVLDPLMERTLRPTRVSELLAVPIDFPFTRIDEVLFNGQRVWLVEGTSVVEGASGGFSSVTARLWIDPDSHLILAAETLVADDDVNPVETIRITAIYKQRANPDIPDHVFAVPNDAPWEPSTWGTVVPHQLPDAKAQTLDGKTVALKDLLGRVTIYYVWDWEAVALSPLVERQVASQMFDLHRLHESFAEQGLHVVGVCVSACEYAQRWLNQLSATFEQLVMDPTQLAALRSAIVPIADAYLFVVDHRGDVRYAGNDDTTLLWANLDRIVSNLLDDQ